MKKNIKNLLVFLSICSVIALLLAGTNFLTAPVIEKNQSAAANQALLEVMPDADDFDSVDLSAYTLPATVTEAYRETRGQGYVFKLKTAGYGSDMILMCGVHASGTVTGAVCLSSNETLGYEKTYGTSFKDKDAAGVDAVDTVAGATKTTGAYKSAVKDALNAALILLGADVDIRTEEEILADNLAAALPAGEKNFEKIFLYEDIRSFDAIYRAANGAGYVFVIGEQFIGASADGTVLTEGAANAEAVKDAVTKITATAFEEIDLSAYAELQKFVVSAKKTQSGNYVFETKGAGYGIKGGNEWHPASGEYIVVRVSMTEDGRIIDCLTLSEGETDGLGDACADEKFYGQFDGKTEENYGEIDGIAGATMTTDGYKQAIFRAFTALNTLKGVGTNE